MFEILVTNPSDIRTPIAVPNFVDITNLLSVREKGSTVEISHTPFRDSQGRISLRIGPDILNKTIIVTLLWAKIIARGISETDSEYLARLLYHFNLFAESLISGQEVAEIVSVENQVSLYSMPVGLWSSDLERYDFFGTPYFSNIHQVILNSLSRRVEQFSALPYGISERVSFVYLPPEVDVTSITFSQVPLKHNLREFIPDKLRVLTVLFPEIPTGRITMRYV